MNKISIINGPNLNLLGERETQIYGPRSLKDLEEEILSYGREKGLDIVFSQSNSESEIIEAIHSIKKASDVKGLIINAGAYTHTSIAIMDALKMLSIPVIEVHLSNIFQREEFRRVSYISYVCTGIISGLGMDSYLLALQYLSNVMK